MTNNRSGNHLKYRYGICLNDNCEKCKSKEKQQILAHKDFVCSECGKNLRECPPPPPPINWIKIICIAVGVIAVAALVWWIIGAMSSDSDSPVSDTVMEQPVETAGDAAAEQARLDSLAKVEAEQRVADSIRAKQVQDSIDAAKAAPEKSVKDSPKETSTLPASGPKMPTVSFGVYSGPANGLGGEIKVTKAYTLDLRTPNHDVIELQPGDIIKNVQIKNGELKAGMWQRGSERRAFNR